MTSPHGPVCPDDCPEKEKHQAYADRLDRWRENLSIDASATAGNPNWAVVHKLAALDDLGADHDKTCPLLYGNRSLAQEVSAGMATLLKIPREEIAGKVQIKCGRSTELEAFTLAVNPGVRHPNRVVLSHGFHSFSLNCSLISSAFFDYGKSGRVAPISLARGQALLMDQLYFFWTQADRNLLMFPFDEFDYETYRLAGETTMLIAAFLLAHEVSHVVISTFPEHQLIVSLQELAAEFMKNDVPPPFLGVAPFPNWEQRWITEFACDALGTLSVLACSEATKDAAFHDAPKLSEGSTGWRQMAIEAQTHYLEALYLRNLTRAGAHGKTGLEVLYGGTHPMPNLRRTFIRGIAAGFVTPNLLKQTDRFAEVFKTLFDRAAWLSGGSASDKESTQREADAVVPDFIKRYDEFKERLDLLTVTNLGTEVLTLLHRFRNTTYGLQLTNVEKQLREQMEALAFSAISDKVMALAGDGQYSAALQRFEQLERELGGAINANETMKKVFENLRSSLKQIEGSPKNA